MIVDDSQRPWIAYVGPFAYPAGGAAARRVLGMAESLVLAGRDVVIASGADVTVEGEGRLFQQQKGIAYCLLAERVAEHWPRPLRRFRYAWMGARTVEWLSSLPTLPEAIILYSGYTPYLQRLLPWCRRNNVRLLFDAVEWYEPAKRWQYLVSPYQWNIEWAMRHLVPKVDAVIAISQYLYDYYSRRGLPVAIVPPTTSAIAPGEWHASSGLRLCYAGNPAHKDDLASVLQAVARLAFEGASIHLTVAGPEREEVMAMLGKRARRDYPWLATPGMLSHFQVQQLVASVDFSILARKQCRTSQAGFPTKFVESFAAGTPVIANLTSDLHLHLRDGETGLVCQASDVDSIASTLERAMAMGDNARKRMRVACLAQASRAFHPDAYVSLLRDLVCPENEIKEN